MEQITIPKPWGNEIIWARTYKYVGKKLFIQNGEKLSLQYHKIKDETIYVVTGLLTLEYLTTDATGTKEVKLLKAGDSFHIPPGMVHRMIANHGNVEVMEVSTPELEDVVRLQDDYGRS